MNESIRRLEGRRILITGAASGIGLATARRFVEHGARVALLDRDLAALERAADALQGTVTLQVDVADNTAVEAAVQKAARALSGLDGVVNAAGVSVRKPFSQTSVEDWRHVMAVNLDGPFHVCRAAVEHLKRAGGGTIVNIASGAGLRPLPDFAAYCGSKGGLVLFSKALAMDLAADHIRVNVVCPGVIMTPMVERRIAAAPDRTAATAKLLDRRLIQRFGQPEEVADAVLFLTSQESSFVTGSALGVDGGAVFH